ncbi:AAA family ATPase [Fibrobacter sp.]
MKKLSLNLVDYDKNGNPNLHGLNWGNRKDGTERDKNEAYLQLTPEIYSTDYFPPKGKYFITETDDGETLILVRAQKPIGTALQTPENNAILGRYLRKRLSLEEDEEITAENVEAYRTTISFYKKDDLHYFLDYSKNDDFFDEAKNDIHISSQSPFTPSQIIYYGVPGCGKSYEVNKVINDELDKYGVTDKEYHKVRCVFHPEYCNADFVGQIYPYVKPDNGGVEYRFKPGPFAEIVRRAYRNPAEPFFLIIEEINRGNAAAIFGEMFQLLDRIRPEDGPEELSGNIYNTGWSSYGVTNIDVNAYVRQKSTDNPEKIEYDDSIPYGDKIKFINNTAVRLPPNLSIYATMNTNDQNVFTMDNAFQRRFKSKMIRNVLDENSAQYKTEIDDTGVYWGDFRKWINEKILLPQTAVLKADDKCLGGWFITGEKINGVDKIKKEDFAEKVLKYLWDDVFKRNKSGEIFVKDDKVNSLSDLIDAFETSVGFESFEKIFKMNDVDKAKLQKQANT